VNRLPVLTAPIVDTEHLAVDLPPRAKLALRARLDNLAFDLRRRERLGSRRAHPVHLDELEALRSGCIQLVRGPDSLQAKQSLVDPRARLQLVEA
jgi:hypothetical protein